MPTFQSVQTLSELLLVAVVVALLSRRFRIPYTIALVVVGLVLGWAQAFELSLSTDLILFVFVPPLLFEGTLAMDMALLRERWREVLTLTLPGTALSIVAVAVPAHFLLGFAWPVALLLGAILAPTDPVSVLALLKELGVPRRLSIIIEGESCFNDGVGIVFYLVVARIVLGEPIGHGEAIAIFTREALGGLAAGILVGYLVHRLLQRVDDHLIEVTISVALAFGVYILATRMHASGVIAVVAAGLIIGNYARRYSMSPSTRVTLSLFWEVMAFVANSLLFLLMGLAVNGSDLFRHAGPIVVVFVALSGARMLMVYGFSWLLARKYPPIPLGWQTVIGWGGVRGSIPIALALGMQVPPPGVGVPTRDEMLAITYGVVLLSLLIQGLTMKPLLYHLGIVRRDAHEADYDRLVGMRVALRAEASRLEAMNSDGHVPAGLYGEARDALSSRMERLDAELQQHVNAHADLARDRRQRLNRALLLAARAAVDDAARTGVIGTGTAEHVAAALLEDDSEEA